MSKNIYKSPIGNLQIEDDGNNITSIEFITNSDERGLENTAKNVTKLFEQLDEYFSGKRRGFSISYNLDGTDFQKRVWKALEQIPYGETKSYKDIATAIGNRRASRAVGTACKKNPLPIIIPCHRVIGSDGSLTGFGGGLNMKSWLLEHENNNKS
jgi:methylated-DNA-[protein]-cysteine S-methyltransferase